MLRTALKILLALVLVLNGFAMPVAMAAHADAAAAAPASAVDPPCHVDMPGDDLASADPQTHHGAERPATGKHSSSCCSEGHCVCGCPVSLTAPGISALTIAFTTLRNVAVDSLVYSSTRHAVGLRPLFG